MYFQATCKAGPPLRYTLPMVISDSRSWRTIGHLGPPESRGLLLLPPGAALELYARQTVDSDVSRRPVKTEDMDILGQCDSGLVLGTCGWQHAEAMIFEEESGC